VKDKFVKKSLKSYALTYLLKKVLGPYVFYIEIKMFSFCDATSICKNT